MKLVAQIAIGTFLGSLAMLVVFMGIGQSAAQDAAVKQANLEYAQMQRR